MSGAYADTVFPSKEDFLFLCNGLWRSQHGATDAGSIHQKRVRLCPECCSPCPGIPKFAEEIHFDGIRYPSAMDRGGTNIVLFDPAKCDIGPSELQKVTDVNIEYTDDLAKLTDDYPEPWPSPR